MRFVSVKKNDIKGRKNDLKSVVNAFKKVVYSNPTKEFAEYFKKENEKSREHKKSLMRMQCNMQLQTMQILSQSHGNRSSAMPANYTFGYGYPMTTPPILLQDTVTSRGENIGNNNHGNSNSTGIFSYVNMLDEN